MKNFIKGFIGGIGNIVPGLSGSAFLIILGVYEKCLNSISNIFSDFKNSFKYLFPIGMGIILGTLLFSNIIEYMLTNYLMITSIVFAFFVFGTIPSLLKKAFKYGVKLSYFISFFITFSLGVILLFIKSNNPIYEVNYNIFELFIAGFLISISTIIPGISSTVLLNMCGMYTVYINAISSLNISILFPIMLGFLVCSFFLSKLISYLLKNYYGYTFFGILGFTISTIPSLIMTKLYICNDLFIGIILGFLAFIGTFLSLKNVD